MFFSYIIPIIVMLFFVSLIGYILVVLKEKLYLNDNMIIIGKKSVTQEHIDETDMKVFSIGGVKLKSGDEIRVTFINRNIVDGIVIGAKTNKKELLLVTHRDEVKTFKVDRIKRIKIVSKYGRFF